MYKLINIKIKQFIGEENLDLIKHSKNYLTADFFAQALGFITVPIFTRLLTPHEYGILAIFNTLISILVIFFGLNIFAGIKQYYMEKTDDFGLALGSNLVFLIVFNLFLIIIAFILEKSLARFFGLRDFVFFFAVLITSGTVFYQVLLSYLQSSQNSKKYSMLEIIKNSSILIISIIFVIIFKENKYLGRIYGQLIITGLVFIFTILFLNRIAKYSIQWKYIKFTLNYGMPLIPHTISTLILAYFDRLMIQQLSTTVNTGLYSFAYNVGMLMNVVAMASSKAWQPIFYQDYTDSKYQLIEKKAFNYTNYIYIAAIGLILFSKEIVIILADKKYYSALNLIPVIILGYVMVYLYTFYFQYASYRRKTVLISLSTLIAAVLNIVLNYLLIPRYGYFMAAYATLASYTLLLVLHYMNARYILKEHVISLTKIMSNFWWILLAIAAFFLLDHIIYFVSLFIKLVVMAVSVWFLLKENYDKIMIKKDGI
jgi:O-antigen/teichoic acid export membrane protein